MEHSDEYLMLALAQGDAGALEALVRRYHGPLLGFFVRQGTERGLAEDLAQECFVRVFGKARMYRYPAPFRPWFYRLAVNLWRDQAKSATARREVPAGVFGPDLDPVATDPLPGPPEQAERRLAAEQVWHAVSGLPKGMREVIVLRFGQDLKVTEIASALGLAEGTVKTRLYYGLRRLREPLAEVGTDHDA